MRSLRRAAGGAVLLASLFVAGAWAAGAAVAATRFAAPSGNPMPSECTDPAAPCSLQIALQSARKTDTLSLAGGKYDTSALMLRGPLHWTATDPDKVPMLVTSSDRPTLSLTTAQSGSTFDHLLIGGTNATGSMQPAIHLDPGRLGVNAMPFAGRLSRGRPLSPGTYVVTAPPTDSAHAVGQGRSVRLVVLAATGRRR